jgi:hypothetical protein
VAVITAVSSRHRTRLDSPTLSIVAVALAGLVAYVLVYRHYLDPHQFPVIRADGFGYYSYLPAYLLERDPTFHLFVSQHLPGVPLVTTGFSLDATTGNYLNRYPIGEAVMLLPFFLVGHAAAVLAGRPADGFSLMEQGWVGLGGLAYMVLGLWVLSLSLRRHFTPLVTTATLLTMVFGTNLFHYSTMDSMFSHAFSFCLVAMLIALTHRWYDRPTVTLALGLGLVMGMIVLVRQSNAVFLLILPLFGLDSPRALTERVGFWVRNLGRTPLIAAAIVAVLLPQLWVWHLATGQWLVYSYGPYHFDFRSPHILGALFSFFPHGAFPWSPALLLAVAGLVPMWRWARPLFLPALVVSALFLYIIASWQFWSYGGGYGHRGFIDLYPLLAFALGSLYSSLSALWSRLLVGGLAVAACILVTVQMIHFWQLLISFEGATFQDYVSLLGRGLW